MLFRSWGEKVSHPKQVVKKGERVRCKVLEIDPSQQRISLGLKQLEPDPWVKAREKYPVGSAVEVKVTRMTEFGAFVELEDGIEGLAHVSTLTTEKGQRAEEVVKVGDLVTMKVIKFDLANHKISLSLKDFVQEQERLEVKKYMSDATGGNATLGELLGEQMRALMKKQQSESEGQPKAVSEPPAKEAVVETAPVVEEPTPVETPVVETAPVVEEPTPVETPVVETAPVVEEPSPVETQPVIEEPAAVEETPSAESTATESSEEVKPQE